MREQTIILQSSDGHDFEVPIDAAKIADLVQDSVGVAEEDEADDDDGMPSGSLSILRVKKDCLQKVVDYMKHYKEEPMRDILTPLGGNTFDEVGLSLRVRQELLYLVSCQLLFPAEGF